MRMLFLVLFIWRYYIPMIEDCSIFLRLFLKRHLSIVHAFLVWEPVNRYLFNICLQNCIMSAGCRVVCVWDWARLHDAESGAPLHRVWRDSKRDLSHSRALRALLLTDHASRAGFTYVNLVSFFFIKKLVRKIPPVRFQDINVSYVLKNSFIVHMVLQIILV